ncbi:MAG: glycosyltransferase [Luteimonas sp.]
MNPRIAAVVVTYNRKALLERCLRALTAQTRKPDVLVVVDNASVDGTAQMLADNGWLSRGDFVLLQLPENTGGAGGFAAGIAHATGVDADWTWLMDDDATPHPDALERLLRQPLDAANLYGSAAVCGDRLSWPMAPLEGRGNARCVDVAALPEVAEVAFIPFLGLLVGREMVSNIGVPDAGFFIAADDVEYCVRARRQGARILLVRDSRIEHPASDAGLLRAPGIRVQTLRLPPWKRYYDVRNRILIARSHYGLRLYCMTIPGTILRLAATLASEGNRIGQLRAFAGGMVDGLLGRKGRRHERWGIRA